MFRDSFSRPTADTRHYARLLVSHTAEHRERLEAMATLAEGDVRRAEREVADATEVSAALRNVLAANLLGARSEERRVGKECRSRWSPSPREIGRAHV